MKSKYCHKVWSLEEMQYLADNYLSVPIRHMVSFLGCSRTAIVGKMKKMELVVPQSIIVQRLKQSQFKKGQPALNKGKKWKEFRTVSGHKKSLKTAFKKGNKPHNTQPVGTINTRLDKTGNPYKFIKIANRNWQHLHRFVWEKTNGPIPSGHVIRFKDGDQQSCAIENLECITKKENMLANSQINYTPELLKTIKLKNKLILKIQNYEQQQQSQHS